MYALARFSILAFATLLTTCASKAPPPAPTKQVVFRPATNFSPAADDVLFRALGLVGAPYRWGGNTPDSGLDCSGLVNFICRGITGIKLPRSAHEMISMCVPSVPVQALQAGDLMFFATPGGRIVSHAGVYVGEGRFVHTPHTDGTVRLDSLQNSYWQRAYLDAKCVLVAPSPLAQMP